MSVVQTTRYKTNWLFQWIHDHRLNESSCTPLSTSILIQACPGPIATLHGVEEGRCLLVLDTIRKWNLNYLGWACYSQSTGTNMYNRSASRCRRVKWWCRRQDLVRRSCDQRWACCVTVLWGSDENHKTQSLLGRWFSNISAWDFLKQHYVNKLRPEEWKYGCATLSLSCISLSKHLSLSKICFCKMHFKFNIGCAASNVKW